LTVLLAIAIALPCIGLLYKALPPSIGVQKVVCYEVGLLLVEASGRLVSVPWGTIDACKYVTEEREWNSWETRIRFAQLLIYTGGSERPIVLIHLRSARRLAEVVNANLDSSGVAVP
jgi:hypothetical protein